MASIKAIVTENQKRIDRIDDIVTENQRRIGQIPGKVLREKFPLQGMHSGTSDLATKGGYEAHNFTQTHQLLAGLAAQITGLSNALEQATSTGTVDLEAVKEAAAEGARQGGVEVSAEDVARLLTVTVDKPDEG